MNYTTITINNEKIGLKFGMASFRYLSEGKFVEGKSFQNNIITEIGIAHIIYSGYMNNCLVKEIEEKYSFEFFVDLVESKINDSVFIDQLKSIMAVWSQSDFIKTQPTNDAKKKNIRGKK
jgi:hypothetical protein